MRELVQYDRRRRRDAPPRTFVTRNQPLHNGTHLRLLAFLETPYDDAPRQAAAAAHREWLQHPRPRGARGAPPPASARARVYRGEGEASLRRCPPERWRRRRGRRAALRCAPRRSASGREVVRAVVLMPIAIRSLSQARPPPPPLLPLGVDGRLLNLGDAPPSALSSTGSTHPADASTANSAATSATGAATSPPPPPRLCNDRRRRSPLQLGGSHLHRGGEHTGSSTSSAEPPHAPAAAMWRRGARRPRRRRPRAEAGRCRAPQSRLRSASRTRRAGVKTQGREHAPRPACEPARVPLRLLPSPLGMRAGAGNACNRTAAVAPGRSAPRASREQRADGASTVTAAARASSRHARRGPRRSLHGERR